MLQSGTPFDTVKATERSYTLIERVLDSHLEKSSERANRKIKEESAESSSSSSQEEKMIENEGESILKR